MSVENKFQIYLSELIEYQKEGENLDIEKFEEWKNKILAEFEGSYKIMFNQLKFYTISKDSCFGPDDDLPF